MKYQVLFSLKKTMKKYLQMPSAAIVIGASRVNAKDYKNKKGGHRFKHGLECLTKLLRVCLGSAMVLG